MTRTAAPLSLAEAHVRGLELVRRHTERFTAYVTALDEAALAARVPGTSWTVGETVTHVQSVFLRYTTDLRRADSPQGVTEQNAEDIERLGVDVAAAAKTITEQVDVLEAVLPHIAPDRRFPFHAGQETTMAGGWGNLIGELLAHGDDIARATSVPFGIAGDDTEILWRFTAPLLQGWLRPETAEIADAWLLRFPFGPIGVLFDRGRLHWGLPIEAPDHVVEVDDAVEWTLAFPYRRRPAPDEETARLTGRFFDL